MQLVEQGKLDLDTDVNAYLQGMQLPRTFAAPVTLRSLMTHTAGFEEGSLFYLTALDPQQQLSIGETMTRHMAVRVRPPLTLSAYSNYGAALAGLIVEQVSGTAFNDYVRLNIFEPLGMRFSTFEEPLPARLQGHEVGGYEFENGEYVKRPFEIIGGWRPAGSASAPALDMTRFMLAYLQGGEYEGRRILRPETVASMHSTAFRNDERLSGMALGFYEWSVNGLRVVGHAGDTDFFHTELALLPEQQLGLFISFTGGGSSEIRSGLLKALADRYFPRPVQPSPAVPTNFAQVARQYVGAYQPSRRNISDIYKLMNLAMQIEVASDAAGRLLVGGAGGEKRLFIPVGEHLFQEVGGEQRIAFRVDPSGHATHLFFDGEPYWGAERTPWYESPRLARLLLGFCIVTFIVVPFVLRRCSPHANQRTHGWAVRLANGTSAWALLTIFAAVVTVLSYADAAFYGVPAAIKMVLLLPLIFAAATAIQIGATVKVWADRCWTLSQRLVYTFSGVAAVILCILFYQWNVFGWQFG